MLSRGPRIATILRPGPGVRFRTGRLLSALGLAAIALRAYGRDVSGVRHSLERQAPITCDLGQQLGVAMALLALEEGNADAAFSL